MKNFKRIIFCLLFCFNKIHLFNCHANYQYNENVTSMKLPSTTSDNIFSDYNYTIYGLNIKNDQINLNEENTSDVGDLTEILRTKHITTVITETTTDKNNFDIFMQNERKQQIHKQQQQQSDKYLEHIFNKYGNQDLITFEGLEHLMHNLGLGGLGEFKHTLEEHHPDGYQLPELPIFDEIEVNKQENILLDENETKINDIFARKEQEENETIIKHTDESRKVYKNENNTFEEQTIDDEINFKAMHDPKHRHPRHHDHGMITKSCLTPTSIVKLLLNEEKLMSRSLVNYKINNNNGDINQRRRRNINNQHNHDEDHDDNELEINNDFVSSMKLTRNNFINLCPILLVQLEQNACNNDDMSQRLALGNNYSRTKAWTFASIAILIISMCGLAGVTIVPLARTLAYQEILRFLVALAVGTLCGDALMHLMPHALTSHKYGNKEQINDEAIWLCAFTFLSVLFMYVIEVMLPLLRGDDNSEHGHGHSHHHHHDHQQDYDKQQQSEHNNDGVNSDKIRVNKDMTLMMDENLIDTKNTKLHPVAFMVVIGDGLHNLTDGLAIGAAFAIDPVTGMATAFAVLCHELPHELGDFALLLKTGVTIKRALFLNIVSSILSFIGMACGLLIAGIHTSFVKWIYSATAGSFLYIALADLLPEMGRGGQKSFKSSIIQIIGISIGGLIMLIIAINEDSLRMLFE